MQQGILNISDAAAELLRRELATEDGGTRILRVRIAGESGRQFTYDLEAVQAAMDGDEIVSANGITLAIPGEDIRALAGAQLETRESRLVIINRNRPKLSTAGHLIIGDALSCEIERVLRERINPNLDAHGGLIEYVGHDGQGGVHLLMDGGCHGCAMAGSTMFDGVARILCGEIPGVLRVVDDTDHSTGSSPYYHQ